MKVKAFSLLVHLAIMVAGPMLVAQSIPPPRIGTWKNFTSMISVRQIAISGDTLWSATTGGLFRYIISDSSYSTFTTTEGLTTIRLSAVATDPFRGVLLVGAENGTLFEIDPRSGALLTIRDIAMTQRVSKAILRILPHNRDTVYIATEFGIAVYLPQRREFGDSYLNFGFGIEQRVFDLLIYRGEFWAATSAGIATAPYRSPGLSGPSVWRLFRTAQGLPSNTVRTLALYNDTLVAGTESGAAFLAGAQFTPIAATSGRRMVSVTTTAEGLYWLSSSGNVFNLDKSDHVLSAFIPSMNGGVTATDLDIHPNGEAYIATHSNGVLTRTGTIFPNGPNSNLFVSLALASNGTVWNATGIMGGTGFNRLDMARPEGERWKNFSVASHPSFGSDNFFRISATPDGRVWAGNWGAGIAEIRNDTLYKMFTTRSDPSVIPTVTLSNDPHFAVMGGVVLDARSRIWMNAYNANTGTPLLILESPDTSFRRIANSITPTESYILQTALDRNNTLWFANSEPGQLKATGMLYYNEDAVVSGTSSTLGWGKMTTNDGLPSDVVYTVFTDNDGNVCVGTELGLMIITDTRFPKTRNFKPFSTRGQAIQAIAMDALNNKWLGTKDGVVVLNPDGSQVLAQYSVSSTNGLLLSDNIRSIVIDQEKGLVYVGTESGLSTLAIAAVTPSRSTMELEIAPNPFILPRHSGVTIRKLVASATIKILTADGTTVQEFGAQGGGRAFWDGRNLAGVLVASGVYFIVAFADDGEQIATGKLAVVRE